MTCRTLACPNCHLVVPRGALEVETLFLSILGSASSGKSYFLAAMMSQLRKVLPFKFSVNLTDVDLETNRSLNLNEEKLLHHPESETFQPLSDLIEKTFEQGALYERSFSAPSGCSFHARSCSRFTRRQNHPNQAKSATLRRLLCLYDNAGEHFEPGRDEKRSPVTRHLASSRLAVRVRPDAGPGISRRLREHGAEMKMGGTSRLSRQDVILNEAARGCGGTPGWVRPRSTTGR